MISDTFVLGWHREADRLVFAVEASLWPGHPDYEPPRPDEWTCYKPALLVFESVSSVVGLLDMASVPTFSDQDGSRDYGSLHELAVEPDGFLIAGEFGVVHVKAGSVRLEISKQIA